MEKEANYFTGGIFVSLTLLALVGFLIWLAGVHDFAHHRRYTLYFTDPVNGLSDEAVVTYKGVEVGKVLELRLSATRQNLVKVDIEVKDDTPVRAGTKATIGVRGIIGVSYVQLATDDNADQNPPPSLPGEKYPVLRGTGSKLDKFFDDLPQLSQHLMTTLSGIDDLTRQGAKTADSMRGLTDKLTMNPSQIISSPSREGVKIPK
jgi:phospholipid/cholesterol/gamma-HCH transport system substrate-binding protein